MVSPVHYIAIPLFAAFLIPLMARVHPIFIRIIPGLVLLYLSFVSVVLMTDVMANGTISEVLAGWRPPFGINLVFSAFSGFLASIMTMLGFVIWLYTFNFKKETPLPQLQKYYILFLMIITGAIGIVLTGDIFNLFVFMEITAISAYALTAFYRNRDGAEAAFKYLLIGSLASVFILLAIIILYANLGTLNMAEIAQKVHTLDSFTKGAVLLLFFIGFGIEAEMFPLNGWAPDAYSQAPGPVDAIFSGIVVKAGLYALIRVTFTMFDVSQIFELLLIMGVITMVVAEVSALKQNKLKRMLAYSSIGQVGLIMIALGMHSKEAIFAAIFLIFNHAIIKGLLFLSGSYLVYTVDEKRIDQVNGLGKVMPLTSFLFAFGAFAIVGLPPFSGFWSKLYILIAAADQQMLILIGLILVISIVEIVYYFRVIHRLYYKEKQPDLEVQNPTWNAKIAMLVLAAVILAVGVYPDSIIGLIENATNTLMDKQGYIDTVLSYIGN